MYYLSIGMIIYARYIRLYYWVPQCWFTKKYHTHIPLVSNLNPSIKWGICLLKWWFSRAIPQVSWIISTQTSQQTKPHNLQFHWFIVFIQLFGILIMDHNPQSCSNIEISQMEVSENGGNPQIIKVIQPCFLYQKPWRLGDPPWRTTQNRYPLVR